LVEQWTENPRVGGSIPPLATIYQSGNILLKLKIITKPMSFRLFLPIPSNDNQPGAIYPALHENDDWEENIRSGIAAELAQKLPAPKIIEMPVRAGDSTDSAD
jgi:hypothetical protein